MKCKLAMILISSIYLHGCATNMQTPFSVEDPSINGEQIFAKGTMVSSTKQRYWMAYKYALNSNGYTYTDKNTLPYFELTGIGTPTSNKEANFLFWKEGQAYAKTLCSDFFRRISRAKAHRDNAQKQTNIAGGVITAGMGLGGASSAIVGATGLLFSGAESSFEAYNSSFLVTPDLGLMEALIRAVQGQIRASVTKDELLYVSDVITNLNEYVYPCTFTGMQALLDDSLNKKLSNYDYIPFMEKERSPAVISTTIPVVISK